MNRSIKISLVMTGALVVTLLMTSFTHYMFTLLPESLNTSMDINARDIVGGLTPLMRAAEAGDVELAKDLIAKGADLNAFSANQDRDTALNLALINALSSDRILEVAKLLIESGADIHQANARGEQPVHTLLRLTDFDKRLQILDMLMARGADINAQTKLGETMLHISVNLNYPLWFEMLNRKYGQVLNYNIRNNDGQTPEQYAAALLRVGAATVGEAVRIRRKDDTIDNGGKREPYIGSDLDVRATDSQGRTGLMLAIIRGDEDFAKKLVQEMKLRNVGMRDFMAVKDMNGNTALHYAVLTNYPTIYVKLLLQNDAPIDAINNNGDTPLLLVPTMWRKDYRIPVAQILLDGGASVSLQNNNGMNVAGLALQVGDKELQKAIESTIEQRLKKLAR